MSIRGKFRGQEALMRRRRQLVPDIDQETAKAKLEAAIDLAGAIEARAPLGETGDYRESIKGGLVSDNPGGSAVSLSSGKDPTATGVFARFTWRWLEFGTVERTQKTTGRRTGKVEAQPHIFPTFRAKKKAIRRRVSTAINRAVRKAGGK